MTWVSVICLLVLSSAALSNASYGTFSSRMLAKPRVAMIAPLATQAYQVPAIQPMMQATYGASYGSVSPFRQFDMPVAPSLPLSEADIFCKGKRPESIFPIGDGEKYIVCVDDGKGQELTCPAGLIWDNEKSRCEHRIKATKNPCEAQPCLNGGQCFPTEYSFQCKCAPGFEGLTCELDARVCQTQQPCGGFGAVCQSFHLNAALQHVCILQDGNAYGLSAQQTYQNPCLTRDGLYPLAFSNKGYISCNGEIMYVHSCPGGTVWNDLNKVCVWSEMEFSEKHLETTVQQGYGQSNYGAQIELPRPIARPIEKTFIQSTGSSYGSQVELPRVVIQTQPRVSSYGSEVEIQRPVEVPRTIKQTFTLPQQVSSYGSQVEIQRPVEVPRTVERTVTLPQQVSSYGSQVEIQRPVERTVTLPQQVSSYGSQVEIQRPVERTITLPQQVSSYGSQVEIQRPVEVPRLVERTFQHQSSSYGSHATPTLPKLNPMPRLSGY